MWRRKSRAEPSSSSMASAATAAEAGNRPSGRASALRRVGRAARIRRRNGAAEAAEGGGRQQPPQPPPPPSQTPDSGRQQRSLWMRPLDTISEEGTATPCSDRHRHQRRARRPASSSSVGSSAVADAADSFPSAELRDLDTAEIFGDCATERGPAAALLDAWSSLSTTPSRSARATAGSSDSLSSSAATRCLSGPAQSERGSPWVQLERLSVERLAASDAATTGEDTTASMGDLQGWIANFAQAASSLQPAGRTFRGGGGGGSGRGSNFLLDDPVIRDFLATEAGGAGASAASFESADAGGACISFALPTRDGGAEAEDDVAARKQDDEAASIREVKFWAQEPSRSDSEEAPRWKAVGGGGVIGGSDETAGATALENLPADACRSSAASVVLRQIEEAAEEVARVSRTGLAQSPAGHCGLVVAASAVDSSRTAALVSQRRPPPQASTSGNSSGRGSWWAGDSSATSSPVSSSTAAFSASGISGPDRFVWTGGVAGSESPSLAASASWTAAAPTAVVTVSSGSGSGSGVTDRSVTESDSSVSGERSLTLAVARTGPPASSTTLSSSGLESNSNRGLFLQPSPSPVNNRVEEAEEERAPSPPKKPDSDKADPPQRLSDGKPGDADCAPAGGDPPPTAAHRCCQERLRACQGLLGRRSLAAACCGDRLLHHCDCGAGQACCCAPRVDQRLRLRQLMRQFLAECGDCDCCCAPSAPSASCCGGGGGGGHCCRPPVSCCQPQRQIVASGGCRCCKCRCNSNSCSCNCNSSCNGGGCCCCNSGSSVRGRCHSRQQQPQPQCYVSGCGGGGGGVVGGCHVPPPQSSILAACCSRRPLPPLPPLSCCPVGRPFATPAAASLSLPLSQRICTGAAAQQQPSSQPLQSTNCSTNAGFRTPGGWKKPPAWDSWRTSGGCGGGGGGGSGCVVGGGGVRAGSTSWVPADRGNSNRERR